MRKYLFILFLSFTFIASYGQSYSPLIRGNLYWDILHTDGSICGYSGGNRYFIKGDTLISGLEYKKIKTHPIVQLNQGPYCPPFGIDGNTTLTSPIYLREDTINKQVFVFNTGNNNDEILYDFNLLKGDTLLSPYATDGDTLIVDSTNTINLLNGASRKITYLNNGENFIESIGGSNGLQFPLYSAIGYGEKPICTIENNVHIWGNNCLNYVGIKEQIKSNRLIKLFPNPCKSSFTLTLMNPGSIKLSLFDINGKRKFMKTINSRNEKIFIPGFKPGIYFYKVTNQNQSQVGKFMVIE